MLPVWRKSFVSLMKALDRSLLFVRYAELPFFDRVVILWLLGVEFRDYRQSQLRACRLLASGLCKLHIFNLSEALLPAFHCLTLWLHFDGS